MYEFSLIVLKNESDLMAIVNFSGLWENTVLKKPS